MYIDRLIILAQSARPFNHPRSPVLAAPRDHLLLESHINIFHEIFMITL